MPPPRSIRPLAGLRLKHPRRILSGPSPCLLCSSARSRPAPYLPRKALRSYATSSSPPTTEPAAAAPSTDPRTDLEHALQELRKNAANYVNLSRLQLALLGLRQAAGEESIRVAVLGVNNGGAKPGEAAREVLRLLLADPLKGEEEWETRLAGAKRGTPVLIKVGRPRETEGIIERKSMFEEVQVLSPGMDGLNLEVLFMEVNPPAGDGPRVEEALLDLPVDIVSGPNRFSPIMTPVHKTVLVADGLTGVPSVSGLPANSENNPIFATVNIPGYQSQPDAPAPFLPIDVSRASKGVSLFRENLSHGMDYERLWTQSSLPTLQTWVKSGVASQPGTTKPAVRYLVSSVLQNTLASLEASETRAAAAPAPDVDPRPSLRRGLAAWAQGAHAELQDKLDLAFTGSRWKRLNWWKLFWRVDDVGTLTSDMVSRDFLPTAERKLVYLAGQVSAAGEVTYSQPSPVSSTTEQQWPAHISFTKRYLHEETIPALQALAQKLVIEAASTTGLTASLAALLYISQWAPGVYEAGTVVALGAAWSLRRLQGKWEAARGFWEGEVREEGRKAVRGAERSMAEALVAEGGEKDGAEGERVRELVGRAREALERMK